MPRLTRRSAVSLSLAAFLPFKARTQVGKPVRVGVLNDQSSVYSDSSGPGSSIAAQMAAEDFTAATGVAVEVISADHQNKADIGSGIAWEWFDRGGVDAVADLGNSAVALAVSMVARERDKACLWCPRAAPRC